MIDFVFMIFDICGVEFLNKVYGQSWCNFVVGEFEGWRISFYYEYNYEY